MMRLAFLTFAVAGALLAQGYGAVEWVEADRAPLEGTQYKTFHSRTIGGDVNYRVYLPPGYGSNAGARYPVLYELPASGQSTLGGAEVVKRVDQGIRSGRLAPMIVVLVNGLRGNTMYCDTRDGKLPLESVIIKDLLPHIDGAYRTVAAREGRALDGFSMGGFGAAHLGFKYPDLFGTISIMAPPLLGPELKQPRPAQAWSRLFPMAMSGDLEYFRENDPFTLVAKNADKLRDRTVIRIVAHMEEEQWLWPQCEKLHKALVDRMVQHEFYFLTNRSQCLNTMGDGALAFFTSALARPAEDKWEHLPDGSLGMPTEFQGVGGLAIPAYIRKPPGAGPFPAIVMAHGGKYGKSVAEGMGRSPRGPVEDFIQAGWAVYAITYRPSEKTAVVPLEFDDTVEAVKTLRRYPFVDPRRVGYMGGSHGGQVGSRVVSRVDLSGAVLCAPAALDLIEDKKAAGRGEPVVGILKKMVADMEAALGAKAEEIEKDPAKYGYSSALTEIEQVRCPILIGRQAGGYVPAR